MNRTFQTRHSQTDFEALFIPTEADSQLFFHPHNNFPNTFEREDYRIVVRRRVPFIIFDSSFTLYICFTFIYFVYFRFL